MTCFLSLRTQFENLGDEVINTMLLKELCARDQVVALGDGVPDWYVANIREALGPIADRLQVKLSGKGFMLSMLRAGLTGSNSLMFTSCGDVSGDRSNHVRDGAMELLQYLPGMRLGLVGASFSRVSPSKSRLLRVAVSRSPSLSVRDSLSQALLAENGASLPVVPDLAFLLPMAAGSMDGSSRNLAVFQLREIKHIPFQRSVELINVLAAQSKAAGLLPCIAWQVDRDGELSRRLADATKLPIVTQDVEARQRHRAFDELYDRTAVIFSNRLHGLLVAGARGAVPVPLLHPEELKVRGVFGDANLSDLILPVDAVRGLPSAPDQAWLQQNRSRIQAVFMEKSARIRQFFDDILGQPEAGAARVASQQVVRDE